MSVNPRKGCDPDILDALDDLHKQATLERSHFYVGKVVVLAQAEIKALRWQLEATQQLLQARRNALKLPVDPHAADCECADCWQAMEAGGGKG